MNCRTIFSRLNSYNLTRKYINSHKILLNVQFFCSSNLKKNIIDLNEKEDVFDKIVYNEVLMTEGVKNVTETNEPICLKYLLKEENKVQEKVEKSEITHFPYEAKTKYLVDKEENIPSHNLLPQEVCDFTPSDDELMRPLEWSSKTFFRKLYNVEDPAKWTISDSGGIEADTDTPFYFGSYDPNKAVSSVPCGGCGALFHCNDPGIPGFIPAETFKERTKEQLRGEICQRCAFLKELNFALGVNVKASEYSKIISAIKEKEALVILLVDLLDFPCSIYPGIFDLIGVKPVVLVGNKIDLLIQEGPFFLKSFKESLMHSLKVHSVNLQKIKHISLISAKTGYGVEDLIDVLNHNWAYKGDIYLVGCTNSGKSTLFNTLIQSDFCKVKAVNIIQRATVSEWPGTTLNLIKFPITRPTESRLVARSLRLRNQGREVEAFKKVQWLGQNLKLEQIPLKGYVGRTGNIGTQQEHLNEDSLDNTSRKGLDPNSADFVKGKWFYDTPGVVQNDQIINILTTAELMLTVPKKMLLPRNFHLRPGYSIFIGGLARLDYVKGLHPAWFTVFASMELPLTVTKLEDADHVYEKLLGTPLFRVPKKGKERLSKWPKLASKKFEVVGKVPKGHLKNSFKENSLECQADADIVLSSAGWVSVNFRKGYRHIVEAWTPEGRGIHLREIPLIKTGFRFKGAKIVGTPAFTTVMKEVEGLSVTDEPPF